MEDHSPGYIGTCFAGAASFGESHCSTASSRRGRARSLRRFHYEPPLRTPEAGRSGPTKGPDYTHRVREPSLGHYPWPASRSEEHTSELQSLMRSSYAVFCLTKKKKETSASV